MPQAARDQDAPGTASQNAYRVRAGDAGNGPHLRTDDPVLYGTEIDYALKIVGQPFAFGREIAAVALPAGAAILYGSERSGFGILHGPPVDFPKTCGNRTHSNLDAGRKVDLGLV